MIDPETLDEAASSHLRLKRYDDAIDKITFGFGQEYHFSNNGKNP